MHHFEGFVWNRPTFCSTLSGYAVVCEEKVMATLWVCFAQNINCDIVTGSLEPLATNPDLKPREKPVLLKQAKLSHCLS